MKQTVFTLAAVVGALGLFVPATQAAPIMQTFSGSFPTTLSGTLPDQGTPLLETFKLPSGTALTVTTTSYANGGFQPNLLLFNSSGQFVTAGNPFGSPDPSTGLIGDMRLTSNGLAAGTYTLAVTDFLLNQSLTATNLSEGFTQNFGNGTTFVDANGNQRSGSFAFTISAVSTADVPEPSTLWLAAPLLAVFFLRSRKGNQSSI